MNIDQFDRLISPEIYDKFRQAVAIGKWPDGRPLSPEQREICMQAIIAYEHKNLPEEQRTGYVPPKKSACDHDDADDETPIKWQ